MAYNVQTTVDAKHNIPIDFKVTNENDSKAMVGENSLRKGAGNFRPPHNAFLGHEKTGNDWAAAISGYYRPQKKIQHNIRKIKIPPKRDFKFN